MKINVNDGNYLTIKDLKKLGITDAMRNNLIVKPAHVRYNKEGKNHAYCYELPDLIQSVVFRFSLIENYKELGKLDLTGKVLSKDRIMKMLRNFKYADRYWFGIVKQKQLTDHYIDKFNRLESRIKKIKSQESDLFWFHEQHSDLFKLLQKIHNKGLLSVASFNLNNNDDQLTVLLFERYSEKLNLMLNDMVGLDFSDSALDLSDDLSDFKGEADNLISYHLTDKEFEILDWMIDFLRSYASSFESNYKGLIDESFNIIDLGIDYSKSTISLGPVFKDDESDKLDNPFSIESNVSDDLSFEKESDSDDNLDLNDEEFDLSAALSDDDWDPSDIQDSILKDTGNKFKQIDISDDAKKDALDDLSKIDDEKDKKNNSGSDSDNG